MTVMPSMNALTRSMLRNALGLGLFAVVTAGLIALTQQLTAEAIQTQQQRAQASALLEIMPAAQHDNDLLSDRFVLEPTDALGLDAPSQGYRARRDGQVTGVILPVIAADGYSGPIRLIVAIDRAGRLLGVRVLEHHETPGLGDQIEARKSDWIETFTGLSLDQPPPAQWQVKKRGGHFDQFTGATITPSAVVSAVKQALHYFAAQRATLLEEPERAADDGAHLAHRLPLNPLNSPDRSAGNDR